MQPPLLEHGTGERRGGFWGRRPGAGRARAPHDAGRRQQLTALGLRWRQPTGARPARYLSGAAFVQARLYLCNHGGT